MPTYKNDKNGTWFCKFYYTDYNGEKKQKKKTGFKTQREAKAWERDFLETKALDVNIKFSNFVEVYLEDMQTRWKPSTLRSKKYLIDRFLPYFGDMLISDIKPLHIRQWQKNIIEAKNEAGEPHADGYLASLHRNLSAIFNYAVKYYDLKENPCRKAGAMGSSKTQNVDFWTLEEFKTFIKVARNKKRLDYYAMFNILYYTGMRIGELLALTWGDIDLENKVIHITKSLQHIYKEDVITAPKTPKSVRDIAIFDNLADIIGAYKRVLYKPHKNDRLFEFNATSIRQTMLRWCEISGVKRIRIHDLRHSHASLLIELGFPPLLIAERLGHENVKITLSVYSHLYPNKQFEVAEKLQDISVDIVLN